MQACLDKEFLNEANSIIFNFIWKGKGKVKRVAFVSNVEDGGLEAPHLKPIIAPAGFWPRDQNPRRHHCSPRVNRRNTYSMNI